MTNEEMHENLILLEYEKYSEKEYKPMTYAKFVTQKLIEARQELSKLHQPTVISAVCEHCGSDRIKLCSHEVVDYCLDCHNFTSKTDL